MKYCKTKTNIFLFFLLFFCLVNNVTAYSIHNIDFKCTENEEIYERNLLISLSQEDTDNYFVLEKGGNLAPYIILEPNEFMLEKGQTQIVKVKLLTSKVERGNYSGWIIARGQNTISKNNIIGYTISLKSNIKVNMIESEKKSNKLIQLILFNVGIIFLVVIWRRYKK